MWCGCGSPGVGGCVGVAVRVWVEGAGQAGGEEAHGRGAGVWRGMGATCQHMHGAQSGGGASSTVQAVKDKTTAPHTRTTTLRAHCAHSPAYLLGHRAATPRVWTAKQAGASTRHADRRAQLQPTALNSQSQQQQPPATASAGGVWRSAGSNHASCCSAGFQHTRSSIDTAAAQHLHSPRNTLASLPSLLLPSLW